MQKQEKPHTTFRHRWAQGLLAERPEPAIVALALALFLSLLAAYTIVQARLQDQLPYQRGAELITHIRQTGLVELVGRQPQTQFFLIGQQDQITGYAALVLEPQIRPDHSLALTGRELRHWPQSKTILHAQFDLANDLASYLYAATLQYDLQGKTVVRHHEHSVEDHVLSSAQRSRFRRFILPPQNVDQDTLIPTPLRYIAACLALEVTDRQDTIFTVPMPSLKQGNKVQLVDILVQDGASVPNAMKQQHPDGQPLRLTWIDQERRQDLLCDRDHQLLYRRDHPAPGLFWQQVRRDEIINTFPEATSVLEDWLGTSQEAPNGELL